MGFEIRHMVCKGVMQGRTCTQCGWKGSILEWARSTDMQAFPSSHKENQYHLLPQTRLGKLLLIGSLVASIGILTQVL